MSLIGEALKKARQDVARQDALRQRTPYAVGAVDSADRRSSLLPLFAGLGAGCLLAAALLAAAWSAGWGPFARPETTRVAEAASPSAPAIRQSEPPAPAPQAQPQAAPPPPPVEPSEERRPQVREMQPAAPPPQAERPAPAPPAPSFTVPAPPEPVPSDPTPVAPARPSPTTPPQGAANLVDGHTYSGEVPVPGGGMVKLNGIAFSPERPVAVLDGRVMGPGESIQGFTLVGIEAGRVKLQGHGATVYVSPK